MIININNNNNIHSKRVKQRSEVIIEAYSSFNQFLGEARIPINTVSHAPFHYFRYYRYYHYLGIIVILYLLLFLLLINTISFIYDN